MILEWHVNDVFVSYFFKIFFHRNFIRFFWIEVMKWIFEILSQGQHNVNLIEIRNWKKPTFARYFLLHITHWPIVPLLQTNVKIDLTYPLCKQMTRKELIIMLCKFASDHIIHTFLSHLKSWLLQFDEF